MGVVATVEFKKCVTRTRSFDVIVSKLGYWWESCLVVLFVIYQDSEIRLYNAILLFGLAISFWVKGCGKLLFDLQEVTEQ